MNTESEIDLILASASPRRVELLAMLGICFEQKVADINEDHRPGEKPQDFVCRLAKEKAGKVFSAIDHLHPVLGSDTIVVVDEHILGKPADFNDASSMLKMLSGRQHQVMTAVTLMTTKTTETKLSISEVTFAELTDEDIEVYWQTGEPKDKAGSYAVQGIAGQFIREIKGSYSAIMGLPLYETRQLLELAGINVLKKI